MIEQRPDLDGRGLGVRIRSTHERNDSSGHLPSSSAANPALPIWPATAHGMVAHVGGIAQHLGGVEHGIGGGVVGETTSTSNRRPSGFSTRAHSRAATVGRGKWWAA